MSGTLGLFKLGDEIDRLALGTTSGRTAATLLKTPRLRIVLVGLAAGAELKEHTAPGPITIQPIRGRFTVTVGGDEHALAAGSVLAVDAAVPHAVRADEDGAFLLTIVWPGDGDEPPG